MAVTEMLIKNNTEMVEVMRWELSLLLGTGALVSFGCLVPNKWLPTLPNDKFLHFSAFALLTILASRLAAGGYALTLWMAGLALAGFVIECLQNLVPGRSFSWPDQVANTAGIIAAAVASHYIF
jgi:hypothetical protein